MLNSLITDFVLLRPDIITPNGLNVKRDLHEFQNLHAKSKVNSFNNVDIQGGLKKFRM